MTEYDRVAAAAAFVGERLSERPEVALVLGSGLGALCDRLQSPVEVPFGNVPDWPVPGIEGHRGVLRVGRLRGRPVAALTGRVHLYEGQSPAAVVFGIRVMRQLGVRTLVLTNAAGGINRNLVPGQLMLIDDHINLTGANPLVGGEAGRFGPRFPDMSEVYSARLRQVAAAAGAELGLNVAHGVYVGLLGPSFETPAEIRFLRTIGADAVGMSTVLEAIAARHLDLEVLGISCIANAAAGLLPARLTHAEVLDVTNRVAHDFSALVEAIIERL